MGVALTTLVPIVLLLAIVWFWFQWKFRRIISTLSKLPPLTTTWPILGNLPLLFGGHDRFSDRLFKLLQEVGERKQKNVAFWWGPLPYIIVGEAEDMETVLTSKKCEKSFHYGFLKVFLGNGLTTAPEDIHKITRRHCNPLFTPGNLERFSSSFNSSSRKLAQAMSEHVGRGSVDVQQMVAFNTSTTIADLLLGPGRYPDESTELFQKMVPHFKSTAKSVASRVFKPWLWSTTFYNFLNRKEIQYTLKIWYAFCEEVQKKKETKKVEDSLLNNKTSACDTELDCPVHLTLPEVYEAMQQNYPQFTQSDMENEMITLFITGSHTIAVFVSSMFLALANYPDIQERLYQEVVSVVGAEDRDVTTEDLNRMPYLEQVIKEATRRFFVVPLVMRKSNEDLQLRNMTVPAGATMIVPLITQLYDCEVFPDPKTFNPERFSSENIAKIKKHNFTPFGAGTRKCIGYNYAFYLEKLLVVHVVRRFRLTTQMDINNMTLQWDIAAISAHGYPLQIHSRET